ncbi:MAG: hypothetical protein CMJ52_08090 [Planctomycetaceae bacterium]|nr:hypothetical protein [Planctomycetaceae bacterium]
MSLVQVHLFLLELLHEHLQLRLEPLLLHSPLLELLLGLVQVLPHLLQLSVGFLQVLLNFLYFSIYCCITSLLHFINNILEIFLLLSKLFLFV